jgi:S1-C subfamily serine protease
MGSGNRLYLVPLMLLSMAPAAQAQPASQELSSVDYLIGTWSCAHTVGSFSGTYKTTYSKVLGNRWLQQTYDFPAQKMVDRVEPASTAVALMGFDERRQTWVRFFANSGGQYFPIRMTDNGSGWTWKYSTFFTRTSPETPNPDATLTRKSDAEYVIDGPTYPQNGVVVTEHHVCRKASG